MHESDTENIAIPFDVWADSSSIGVSGLTTPGLALGEGQRVDVNQEAPDLTLKFDMSAGQFINLSEVTQSRHQMPF